MYIETFEWMNIEEGIRRFNRIIESKGKVKVSDIELISFWRCPFSIGEIENEDLMRALRWHRVEDAKLLDNFGWTDKISDSNYKRIDLDDKKSTAFNRLYAYRLTLPEPKELE